MLYAPLNSEYFNYAHVNKIQKIIKSNECDKRDVLLSKLTETDIETKVHGDINQATVTQVTIPVLNDPIRPVETQMKRLNSKKASGPDDLSPALLKWLPGR